LDLPALLPATDVASKNAGKDASKVASKNVQFQDFEEQRKTGWTPVFLYFVPVGTAP